MSDQHEFRIGDLVMLQQVYNNYDPRINYMLVIDIREDQIRVIENGKLRKIHCFYLDLVLEGNI